MCCCVCNLLCKIISFILSVLFLVAVVLLILWGVGVIFKPDETARSIDEIKDHTRKMFSSLTN